MGSQHARDLGADFVLHLHGFQNQQHIALGDWLAGLDEPLNDLGVQGSVESVHGRIVRRAPVE